MLIALKSCSINNMEIFIVSTTDTAESTVKVISLMGKGIVIS